MRELLFVNGCVRGKASRTLELCESFLSVWQKKNPDWTVTRLDLETVRPQPLYGADVERRGALERTWEFSAREFDLARQFVAADKLMLAAPFWELSFPAALKLYLEQVSVTNLAFRYDETGACVGLCRADDLLFVTTRGGVYAGTEVECGWRQIVGLCEMYGVKDPVLLEAEGLDDVTNDLSALLADAKRRAAALAEIF